MKKLLLLSIFAGLMSLISFTNHIEKALPPYTILESKADPSLHKNESLFSFTFYDANGDPVNQEIRLSYNGIEKTIQGDKNGKAKIKVKPGKYVFEFLFNDNNYEITTDSILIEPGYRTEIHVNFETSTSPIIEKKPVIYVYPTKSQPVSIKLDLKGKLGFTYPAYQNGWNFIADPDGTIHMNDQTFNYLFWEGNTEIVNSKVNWNEGFVVKKDNLVSFFEGKLSTMGLNSKEIEDFITYWCPEMQKNENNFVHFLFNEQYAEYASLNVNPKPDHMFRVFMIWSKADSNMKPIPQTISTFQREGFTVVEWGGGEMNQLPL